MNEINEKPKSKVLKQILILIAIAFVLLFRVAVVSLSKYHAHIDKKSNIPSQIAKTELIAYVKSIRPSPLRDGSMVVTLKDNHGKEYILSSFPNALEGIKEGDMTDALISLGNIDSIKLIKN